MNERPLCERVHVWRIPGFVELELLHARYVRQDFPRHTHAEFAIGVIEAGALAFDYRGDRLTAPAGSVNLSLPGEVHNGRAAGSDGWTYRMFYIAPELLERTAGEISGRRAGMPYVRPGVLHDETLAGLIRRLHMRLEAGGLPALEREACLDEILARLFRLHAQNPPPLRRVGQENAAVARMRDFIETHSAEDLSGEDLSRVSGLSRFHGNRAFRRAAGVPPHAYLRQVRIRRAKELLAAGESIAAAAAGTGFSDQAHLTRWLKRLWGFTPGEYSNSVQYG